MHAARIPKTAYQDCVNDLVFEATNQNAIRKLVCSWIVNPAIEIAILRASNKERAELRRTQSMMRKPPMTPMKRQEN
jgi:hypothetical protein